MNWSYSLQSRDLYFVASTKTLTYKIISIYCEKRKFLPLNHTNFPNERFWVLVSVYDDCEHSIGLYSILFNISGKIL